MTTSKATEITPRGPGRPRGETMASRLRLAALERLQEIAPPVDQRVRFARLGPIAFAKDILGQTLSDQQIAILNLMFSHQRCAIASGRKIGKSTACAAFALWFYYCFPAARVVMTAVTAGQVERVLWRELTRLFRAAIMNGTALPGTLNKQPETGLENPDDQSEILGFTARTAEAMAGISGPNQLYIVDEASGVDDFIFDAIEGNRAGVEEGVTQARLVLISNPTRTQGEFFRAFDEKNASKVGQGGYHTLQLSSEDSPNVKAGRILIPGLAGREYVEGRAIEWGRDSATYKVQVLGQFAFGQEGKAIPHPLIMAALGRFGEADRTGRLFIGVDVAGPGDQGDESAFAVRRGYDTLEIAARRGLNEDEHLVKVIDLIKAYRQGDEETAMVIVDSTGPIGVRVAAAFAAYLDRQHVQHPLFEIFAVRSSDKAIREPKIYDRVRDELIANLRKWLQDGGSIPDDPKLMRDMQCPEFVSMGKTQLLKLTDKKEMIKILGRSPDRLDALALAVWEPLSYRPRGYDYVPVPEAGGSHFGRDGIDPYAALDIWRQ